MGWYRTGTVSVTNGSTSVTGVDTAFVTNKVAPGEALQAPDGKLYEISAVGSDLGITLTQVYAGATLSGQAYAIMPTQNYIRELAAQAAALVNSNAVALSNHAALTSTHGVAGALVGTTDAQTLTNKTISAASNTITTAVSGNLTSTTLNAALAELQTDVDTRATTAALNAHAAAADPHPDYTTTAELDAGLATKQPLDATLTALAGLATGVDRLPYSTGTDTFGQTPLTAFARTLLDDADAATARATLGANDAANLTGTANININGTVGATTAAAGTFTTVTANGGLTINTDGGATAGSAIDQSAATVSIAASGTKLFSAFSGMILVNNHNSGGVSLFLVGAGSTLKGLTVGERTGSMSYVAPDYVWTSDSTTTDLYTFTKIRTRTVA